MLLAWTALVFLTTNAQTLRRESAVTLSPVDEAVIPEVDETVSLAQREVFGVVLAALVIFVAAGGGTGGGGVLDPIYILGCGLSAKTAIPLSSITILGGAFGNFFLNLRRTRDDSATPLIDWDIILVMQPLLLLGASCGTYLNTVLPTWLLCVLLVIVLSATGTRTLQKAISARQKERWQCCVSPESASLLGSDSSSEKASTSEKKPQADVPWLKLATLVALFVVIAGMRILRGGKDFDSPIGIDSSSALYPVLVAMPYTFLLGVGYFSLKNLGVTYEKQQNPEYEFEPHEIKWTPSSIRFFPFFSLAAGAVSGMFGIGGGIINGPLLLEVGIDASAASAMTATTVLFSSGMSAFNYAVMGGMDMHLAQLLLPVGFLMTYIGQLCLLKVVRRFQCPSLIIFSMAVIVLISAVAMSIESVRALLA
ncbi:Transmembrane protein TauE like [Phytophthora cinnamomi]|uniref:Transmembrane protein TauE like n=1 Tax=Phytophthora cinnamomi TaxID=4785 RepID=UPI003559880B|nr:Transmembrane protein TauE like [Phytophthora cinnamomi]